MRNRQDEQLFLIKQLIHEFHENNILIYCIMVWLGD